MKRLFGFLVMAVVLFAPVSVLRADVITLVADEWCPYDCAQAAKQQGYMIDVARAVFEKAGHTVVYKVGNWSRSIAEVREGKAVGLVAATRSDAEGFVFPEVTLGKSVSGIYALKGGQWRYDKAKGPEQFAEVVVGVVQDYDYGGDWKEYFAKHGKDPKRVQATSGDNALEQNFQKLLKGRVGAVIDDVAVLEYTAGKMNILDKVELVGQAPHADDSFIAFSPANPKSPEYAALLSKGVEDLRASGQLATILAAYGLKDWR